MIRGNQGDLQFVKPVGDPVDGDGKKARITEDDFIVAPGRGVPGVGGADVFGEPLPQRDKAAEEFDGGLLPAFHAVRAGLVVAEAVMADGQRHLFGELLEERGRLLPQVVAHVHRVEPRLDEVARIEDVADPAKDGQDLLAGRDRLRARRGRSSPGCCTLRRDSRRLRGSPHGRPGSRQGPSGIDRSGRSFPIPLKRSRRPGPRQSSRGTCCAASR